MSNLQNKPFIIGQPVQFTAPTTGKVVEGTFHCYGGYKRTEAGTIATTGQVYMGAKWVATMPLDKIKAKDDSQQEDKANV